MYRNIFTIFRSYLKDEPSNLLIVATLLEELLHVDGTCNLRVNITFFSNKFTTTDSVSVPKQKVLESGQVWHQFNFNNLV